MPRKYYYTWDLFEEDVKVIWEKIKLLGLDIKYVYGIPKGGLPLAVKLANMFNVPLLTSTSQLKPSLGKKVLLVDDISDTGETLRDFPFSKKFYTVTLFIKPKTLFVPNFNVRVISNETWCVFPWESSLTPHERQGTMKNG